MSTRRAQCGDGLQSHSLLLYAPLNTLASFSLSAHSFWTHAFGLLLSILGTGMMLLKSTSPVALACGGIYGGCMSVLFLASSVHHTVKRPASIQVGKTARARAREREGDDSERPRTREGERARARERTRDSGADSFELQPTHAHTRSIFRSLSPSLSGKTTGAKSFEKI